MNNEQKALFDALAPLCQKTCLNSLSGMSNIDAYEEAGGKGKTKAIREASASRMLSNVKSKAFLDSMKAVVINDAIMTRTEMLEQLTKLAKLSGEELAKDVGALTELKGGFDVKMKAMDMISKIEGFEAATKYDHTSSDGSMSPGKNLSDEELLRIASE